MMTLHIRVTQRDIDRGLQGDSFRCPAALAVKRAFKADTVWVREVIVVTKERSRQIYATPPEVQASWNATIPQSLNSSLPERSASLSFRPAAWSQAVKARKASPRGEFTYQIPEHANKKADGD